MNTVTTDVTGWTATLYHGLTAGLDRFMAGVPTVLGALLILIIGWVIAGALAGLAIKFFRAVHVDALADHARVNDFLQRSGAKMKASGVLGEVIKWVVRLVFVEMATDQLGLTQVTVIINRILAYIPNILVALLILGLGAFLGTLLSGVVRGAASEAGVKSSGLLAKLASGAVMAFAVIAAVNELGIAPVVVNTLYIGLVAAVSLALGLSFGLGGRDTAARLTEQWVGQAQQGASAAGGRQTAQATAQKAYADVQSDGAARAFEQTQRAPRS